MQLKHLQSITRPGDGIVKVTAVCWAPNGKRLAICATDRVVQMFDEDGVPKDKFFTKPADKVSLQTDFRIARTCHFTSIKNLSSTLPLYRVPKTTSSGKWFFLLILINLR